MLVFLLANWRWLVPTALAVVLGGTVWVQSHRLDASAIDLAAARKASAVWESNFHAADDAAQVNAAALETYKGLVADGEAKAEAQRQDAAHLKAEYDALKRRIHDAPPTDDGPMAPVLRAALDGLRR